MSMLSRVLLACAAVTVCLGCGPKSRLLPNLSCFDAEKLKAEPLVYGEITHDASAPDGWSGMEVFFGVDSAGKLTARIREKGGASKQTRPVDHVTYDADTDSLTLLYTAAGNTKFTRTYRPRCDRLAGFATLKMSPSEPSIVVADTLPRVERR